MNELGNYEDFVVLDNMLICGPSKLEKENGVYFGITSYKDGNYRINKEGRGFLNKDIINKAMELML